jgi:hypothetical protein
MKVPTLSRDQRERFYSGYAAKLGIARENTAQIPAGTCFTDRGLASQTGDLLHRSTTTSPIGCEQQMRILPSAGLSSGSGP